MSATANRVDFRRLELRDLNEIERIERSSYRTPWSRSMFAGELAKPSSISTLGSLSLGSPASSFRLGSSPQPARDAAASARPAKRRSAVTFMGP